MNAAVDHSPARRVSTLKVLGLVFAGLLLMAGITFLWLCRAGNRRYEAMIGKLRALVAETEARDPSRPVLRGTAIPGNGWIKYELGSRELQDIDNGDRYIFGEYLRRRSMADRSKVQELLVAHAAAIDYLRRGAAHAYARFSYGWENGGYIVGISQYCNLADMAVCQARFLAEERKPAEACVLLFDTCRFARDLGFNGPLSCETAAHTIDETVFDGIRDLLLTGTLAREDFLELGRELAAIDRLFPPHSFSLLNDTLNYGYELLQLGEPEGGFFRWVGRLRCAAAFDKELEFAKRRIVAEEKSWREVQRVDAELAEESRGIWNPHVRRSIPGLLWSSQVGRERRAQLRLLRVAAQFRATGEVLEVDDPFGAKLHTARSGDTLKVWSVGADGTDHGGVGDWKPAAGKDIVLDMTR